MNETDENLWDESRERKKTRTSLRKKLTRIRRENLNAEMKGHQIKQSVEFSISYLNKSKPSKLVDEKIDEVQIGTNSKLIQYGFNENEERTKLFLAYDKDNVRDGLGVYEHISSELDTSSQLESEKEKKEFIIASIDMVNAIGITNTFKYLNENKSNLKKIIEDRVNHYQKASLELLPQEESVEKIQKKALEYIVSKFFLGNPVRPNEAGVYKT